MSHFTVLVIGPDHEAQLAPYHEFECTGTDDQYVQDIDETEEARASFAAATTTRLKAADGTLHSFFNDAGEWRPEFSQPEPGPFQATRRTYFVPPGYEKIEVPTSQVETFIEWVDGYYGRKPVAFGSQPDLEDEHKYGYVLLDQAGEPVKIVRRTNPNKKWDWYQVGGRWSGFFKLKDGAAGQRGEPGLMGANRSTSGADMLTKGAIDFAGMRDEAGTNAAAEWDKHHALTGGARWESWEATRIRVKDIDSARTEYHAQPALVAMKADKEFNDRHFWNGFDGFLSTREDYIKKARDAACCTYAVLYKGEWSARGSMGWFGCSDDKLSQEAWDRLFNDLLDGLPDDTPLTIVDCHI